MTAESGQAISPDASIRAFDTIRFSVIEPDPAKPEVIPTVRATLYIGALEGIDPARWPLDEVTLQRVKDTLRKQLLKALYADLRKDLTKLQELFDELLIKVLIGPNHPLLTDICEQLNAMWVVMDGRKPGDTEQRYVEPPRNG